MLTSGTNPASQYLRPEYMSPLPTTLDAKKSPLALLAQTCSQIGADLPTSKPIIPPIEKPKNKDSSKERSSTASPKRSSTKVLDCSTKKENSSGKSSPKSPSSQSSPHMTTIEVQSATPKITSDVKKSVESPGKSDHMTVNSTSPVTTSSSSSLDSKIGMGLSMLHPDPEALKNMPLGTFNPSVPGFGLYAEALARHLQTASSSAPSSTHLPPSLSTSATLGLRPGLPSSLPPGLGHLFGYTRMKTPSGETLVPMPFCRDPYCSGCQYSLHHSQLLGGACPPGCTQCETSKSLGSLATHRGTFGSNLPRDLLSAQGPYMCSWVSGDQYCGKTFTTGEELLQHLRTHTSFNSSDAQSLLHPYSPLLSPLYRYGPPSSRFHPYAKPPSLTPIPGMTPSSLSALASHPSLAPYYSPYSLLGPRLHP